MQGTNPLDQLKDIHLPDPVSAWPPGPGWWLIMFLFIVLVVGLGLYWHKTQWRRQAKRQLQRFQAEPTQHFYYETNRFLKQIAVMRFGHQCASLSGESWLKFLDDKLKKPVFTTQIPEFASAPDDPTQRPDPDRVLHCAKLWIGKHKC